MFASLFVLLVIFWQLLLIDTAWKVSEDGVSPGPYFPVFSPNTRKYGPERTASLDTFHAVNVLVILKTKLNSSFSMGKLLLDDYN